MNEEIEKRFGKMHVVIVILVIVVFFCVIKIRSLEKSIQFFHHVTWNLEDRCKALEK